VEEDDNSFTSIESHSSKKAKQLDPNLQLLIRTLQNNQQQQQQQIQQQQLRMQRESASVQSQILQTQNALLAQILLYCSSKMRKPQSLPFKS
jgi:hypothetical protein